ncbi:EAL domain-containing protein [Lacticaseibacillus suihuaensis]
MPTMTFFKQPIFAWAGDRPRLAGYELLARTRYGGAWELPLNVEAMSPDQLVALTQAAIRTLGATTPSLSLNLHPRQFVRPAFTAAVAALNAGCRPQLQVELTSKRDALVPNRELIGAAQRFAASGVAVVVDDVGAGQNLPGLVEGLTPFASAYKVALQDLQPVLAPADVLDRLTFWAQRAATAGVTLVIEGVESAGDLAAMRAAWPKAQLQGHYLGEPTPAVPRVVRTRR